MAACTETAARTAVIHGATGFFMASAFPMAFAFN
jgi:hypothetical protein